LIHQILSLCLPNINFKEKYITYSCHDVALFDYSEHHPPLSASTTRMLWSQVVNSSEDPASWPHSIRERVNFHRGQRKSFHLTELEVRTNLMFRRKCKRSVKNPATNWSVCHNLGSSWETVWPHNHNAVYIIATDIKFTSSCCIS
jgi:hypothetical protein